MQVPIPLVYVLLRLAPYPVLHALDWLKARRNLRPWRAALERQGVRGLTVNSLHIEGRSGAFRLQLRASIHLRGTLAVTCPDRPLPLFTLRRQGQGVGGGSEATIGDPILDGAFESARIPASVRALLDADTRALCATLDDKAALEIAGREIRLEVEPSTLEVVWPAVLQLARRLGEPLDVPRRLAENALRDPEPGVRLQNLLALTREFGEHPAAREALQAAVSDPSVEIRLRAAMALGESGHGTLLVLAEDPATDDDTAGRAVRGLGNAFPVPRLSALLDRALRARRHGTAAACLQTLGRDPEGVAAVERVLAVETGDLAAVAARALGDCSSPIAERLLVEALERTGPGLAVAAAESLGRMGTAVAVLPLRESEARHGDEPDFTRATRQAVARIQARLSGASPGQLSLHTGGSGQLSVPAAEAGQLSVPDAASGSLSVAQGPRAPRASR